MGNSRQFRPGRSQARLSQKAQIRQLRAETAYYRGYAESVQAQLAATKMERPEDLDEWVESILPDMDDNERAVWDSLSPAEQEDFKESLGQKINQEKLLLGLPTSRS